MDRTIWWDGDAVAVIDQTALPRRLALARWTDVERAATGIETMEVRGAPLIGVAAAHGVALAMAADPSDAGLRSAVARLAATRPTAVNLAWALDRMVGALAPVPPPRRAAESRRLSQAMADDDVSTCARLGEVGVALLEAVAAGRPGPVQVLTHCNAGRLACVEHGTATAPVYLAHARGLPVHVWVSETRPRNQGSSLTAWELADAGVPHTVVVDSACGHLLRAGLVDVCLVGADRIAANGDVANKVGTYLKAVAAADTGVPFHVVAPWSTVDLVTPDGSAIPIEERDPAEVTALAGAPLTPSSSPARNWAFDVTPARLVTSIVTERGIVAPGDLGERA